MLRRWVLLALGVVLAAPAGASAEVFTSSQITSPAEGARFVRTPDAPTLAITGTTGGGDPGEPVRLRCEYPRFEQLVHTPPLVTSFDGTFSASSADPVNVRGGCMLRAVPSDLALYFIGLGPFTGRWLIFERRSDGPTFIDDFVQQDAGGTSIQQLGVTVGGGGLSDTRLTDTAGRRNSHELFTYAGGILRGDLSVDGRTAYSPTHAYDAAPIAPGRPAMTVARTRDGAAGDASVSEQNPLAVCSAACTDGFQSAGVRWDRTTTTSADGTAFEQLDRLESTDGAAHAVAAWVGYSTGQGTPAFGLSWVDGGAPAIQPPATQVSGPPGEPPATLFLDRSGYDANDEFIWPHAAITWDRAPRAVAFGRSGDAAARFELAVPAGGAVTMRTRYLIGSNPAPLAAGAREQRDRARAPSLTLTGVTDGATVLTPTVTVTGTASDSEGLASLAVAGRAVTPAPDRSFSVAIPLSVGENRIEAVATDHSGQETRAARKVIYKDAFAPSLRGISLSRRTVRAGRSFALRFTLGEAARVAIVVSRAGRRVLTLVRRGVQGRNSITIAARSGGRALRRGTYNLRVRANDAVGNLSRPLRATFRVTRR